MTYNEMGSINSALIGGGMGICKKKAEKLCLFFKLNNLFMKFCLQTWISQLWTASMGKGEWLF